MVLVINSVLLSNNQLNLYQSLQFYLILVYTFEAVKYVRANIAASTHLENANRLMLSGKYNDALPHFHEAISVDPLNYLTYFKRATVFLALNRPKSALEDLDKTLDLNKNFTSALTHRASLHFKLGNLDEAQLDYERVLMVEPDNYEVEVSYNQIGAIRSNINEAQMLIEENQHDYALKLLNNIIEKIPWNTELLRLRASAFEKVHQYRRAVNDLNSVAKLTVDASLYLSIAKLCYNMGEVEESLSAVRECLILDPDNKACKDFYKPKKKLFSYMSKMLASKNSNENDDCYTNGKNAVDFIDDKESPLTYSIKTVMCHCLAKTGDTSKGLKICDEAIAHSDEVIRDLAIEKYILLCDKADLVAEAEEYSEAVKLYQESEKLKSNKRAKKGIEKMHRMIKQKGKRDYYKILGVSRHANEQEINRAYRKLAAKWHPDRFQDAAEKKKAQTKFMDIADAKAVLTDKQKRAAYDSGEDPLDPESRQGSRHHPFQGGFHPGAFPHFADGPFQFKFNFG